MSAQIRVGAVISLAAVAAFGVWLALRNTTGSTSSSTTSAQVTGGATAISADGLRTIATALGQPIYWAGPKDSVTYELTRTPDGRIYVRYLPKGVEMGTKAPYLTIGTYRMSGAFAVTKGVAKKPGSVKIPVGGGGVAFYSTDRPTSVYLAFPGSSYQVEVYDPTPSRAHHLVSGGSILALNASTAGSSSTTRVQTPTSSGAVAATPADIKAASTSLGHPVYWAGPKGRVTYELTQTPDGRAYVRYLPTGVAVGSSRLYLTVGTYPLSDAYATTTSASEQAGATQIPVDGGVAFYTQARPTSVYLAFKGVDEQIEVFDPHTAALHKLVAAGMIKPA